MKKINEILDLYPNSLELYDIVDDTKLFSSKKIEEFVKKWIVRSPITNPIKNIIINGITNKKIIIAYESKSKIKNYFHILTNGRFRSKGVYALGWFSHSSNKIVILLDRNVGIFGKAVFDIPPIISHEMCHYISVNNNTAFFNVTKHILIQFYSIFTKKLTGIDPPEKLVTQLILHLLKYNEGGSSPEIFRLDHTISIWAKYYKLLGVNPDQYVKRTLSPYLYGVSGKFYMKPEIIGHTAKCLKEAYYSFNIKPDTFVGQEVIFPSEIISIINEFNMDKKITNLINNTNMS